MKKIVISASAKLELAISKWRKILKKDFEVIAYPEQISGDLHQEYPAVHADFYKSLFQTDVLFVLNEDKGGQKNYIGPSVFAEIAFVIGLNQTSKKQVKILCMNPLPEDLAYSEELLLWRDLGWIEIQIL
ncbi:hypothetical protein COB57_05555 [Candidatus Peregrinibacteria bacterium]|nr:MAG: hypothetical protein COB57_05555 [Candidatus Peregrinibacteria bacterium]